MGLLSTQEWEHVSWISHKEEISNEPLPSQYFRKEFQIKKKVKSARICVSSLGTYQLFINGKKVGNQLFTPGFTSYHKRLQYQVYNVTDMIKKNNAIGAVVGDGWYRGNLGWSGGRATYGNQLALIAQLHITYSDGNKDVVFTDQSWTSSYGPIMKSDI